DRLGPGPHRTGLGGADAAPRLHPLRRPRRRRRRRRRRRDGSPAADRTRRHPHEPAGAGAERPDADEHGRGEGRRRAARDLPQVRQRLLRRDGHPAADDRLRPARLAGRARRLDDRPRHGRVLQDRARLRRRSPLGQPHPRAHPRQHHALLALRHRRVRRPVVLGGLRPRRPRRGPPAAAVTDDPVRLHHLPRRDLEDAAQLGRGELPERRLLQRGRQGRPLRRLGGAGALHVRDPQRVPVTSLKGAAMSDATPTVVLVHGAFADASSWNGVIERLQAKDIPVIAPANPLRGIAHDSAYTAAVFEQIEGPVLAVGHSYGGAVITNAATDAKNVVGLVYVAAFAPDEGETLGAAEAGSKDSVLNSALVPRRYPTGDGGSGTEFYIDPAKARDAFAGDLSDQQAGLIAATQRPVAEAAFGEPNGPPAWKHIPSWTVLATGDKAAGTDVVRSMAERAGAKITEVDGSHVIMVSQPQAVTDVILNAVTAVSQVGLRSQS